MAKKPRPRRPSAMPPAASSARRGGRTSRRRTRNRPRPRTAGEEFQRLVDLMATLRSPAGCPWDREQTVESLRPYVLEEACEVLDAIDRGDRAELCGEVGDLIFEGVFLAQISAEEGAFTAADALAAVADKLVRRHPHVFARRRRAASARPDPAAVREQWDAIKSRERAGRGEPSHGLLDGLPLSLPALLRAWTLSRRAARVGFDWPQPADVIAKLEEEIAEVRQAVAGRRADRVEEEIGDLIFAIASLARKLDVEPESALRRANAKFARRFAAMEARFAARGAAMTEATAAELDREWEAVKIAAHSESDPPERPARARARPRMPLTHTSRR